ncbi:MAG TPA: alpha/beta hydrolase [Elusimicrobia bacterium]|nr:alpha/beta hydrolase [Elusimicrobiota bacterium]
MNLPDALWWLAGLIALWLGLRWFERINLYFPSRRLEGDPRLIGLAFEELRLTARDGVKIHGWFVPLKPESPVIIFCHGNGGNISHRLDKLQILNRAGASILLFDYRGYGSSTGRPTEQGTYQDAEAAYRWLVDEKKIRPEIIVAHEESLGGAVALELAARRKVAGLILESTFTSVVEMGRRVYPFLPMGMLVHSRYDSISKINKVSAPILVMHSPDDDIVPYDMGRKLYEAAPEPKTFLEMKGGHNEGFIETGPAYESAIAAFLRR